MLNDSISIVDSALILLILHILFLKCFPIARYVMLRELVMGCIFSLLHWTRKRLGRVPRN